MKHSAFSLCELLIALSLATVLLAAMVEGITWMRKLQIFNLTATCDVMHARYFLRVECPNIVQTKLEAKEPLKELFFLLRASDRQEISKEQFRLGQVNSKGDTLVEWICPNEPKEGERGPLLFSIRLRFESPSHLRQTKRRAYEVQTIVITWPRISAENIFLKKQLI